MEDARREKDQNVQYEAGTVSVEGFPPKPIEENKKPSIQRSLISLGIFIGLFYLVFQWEISYILILAGVILIHELGHYIAMRSFNYKDLGIFFIPLVGAIATGTKEIISQKQNVIILLAGPLPGVIVGVFLFYFGWKMDSEFILRTAYIFIFLNLFNLLPVMPLDGGRVLKTMFFENNEIIGKVFIIISMILLTGYALYSESYFLLVIPFFMISQLSARSQVNKVKKAVAEKGIDLDQTYQELSDESYWRIRDEIGIHMKFFDRLITHGKYELTANENKIISQVKAIIQKRPIKDLHLPGKVLITLLWILTFAVPILLVVLFDLRV